VIQICRELDITVIEGGVQRGALYITDELFFSGTAAEITPIRSVDRIKIGNGKRGEITRRIQEIFFGITSGERPAPGPWLTYANEGAAIPVENNGHGKAQVKEASASANKVEPVKDVSVM
jgi:branched-chain amino acid aminotransferase